MPTSLLLLLAAAQSDLIAPNATLEKLGEGYLFTEGPARDRNGNVYFTDQPNDRILKWTPGRGIQEWMHPAGRSNGLYFDQRGDLIACADERNELWSISPRKKVTVLVDKMNGGLLNGPNDVWVRPDNALYFTDPLYVRPYWNRDKASQQPGQYVYFLTRDGKPPVPVATDLRQPNGIVGTPDGKTLFVADIGAGKTYRYAIQPDGTLTDKALFCEMGSDGMTLDDQGNVYLTGKGVTVFSPAGQKIAQIDVPEPWTANVTFGGRDRRTLFITASTRVYGLKMRVRGAR